MVAKGGSNVVINLPRVERTNTKGKKEKTNNLIALLWKRALNLVLQKVPTREPLGNHLCKSNQSEGARLLLMKEGGK